MIVRFGDLKERDRFTLIHGDDAEVWTRGALFDARRFKQVTKRRTKLVTRKVGHEELVNKLDNN